ncbi:von Willebrand factor type A domain-containing protein [Lophiotrema nucula]|uniref:von Willebrand factor type A domain-containing protein n=1 Tax=Lophiotrema nucula TaxID=690887 RepID=A0A6A5ZBB2_9PLEO|nr:von Willebrand factor type A domain-containing protein [Lophiotrema nucula]
MEGLRAGVFYDPERLQTLKYVSTAANYSTASHRAHSATSTARNYLPHIHVSAHVSVVDTVSRTTVTQVFSNDTDETIKQSAYCFPLYNGSVITSFHCWLAGETIKGVVKPKDQARREFQEAVERQQAATLLEEHTPEVFETALGNIPSLSEVKVEIVYLTELKADVSGDGILVTIPTSIAPRYGAFPESYASSLTASNRSKAEPGLKIQVDVSAPVPIRALSSRSHPISVELGSKGDPTPVASFQEMRKRTVESKLDNTKARASLSDRTIHLDRDFVLVVQVAPSDDPGIPNLLAPRAIMETCAKYPRHRALKVAFTPRDLFTPKDHQPTFPMEILLLIDRSGSMALKIEALKRALRLFVSELPRGCYLNIVSFGSSYEFLWPSSKIIDKESSDGVQQYFDEKLKADMGSTEFLSALRESVASRKRSKDLITQIIAFTDCEVWAVEPILEYVRDTKEKEQDSLRMFCLGIGDQVSHRMIEGIGKYGGGFGEVVSVNSPSSWDDRIMRIFNCVLTPSDWKCEVTPRRRIQAAMNNNHDEAPTKRRSTGKGIDRGSSAQTKSIDLPAILQAPNKIPTVYGMSRIVIYFLLESSDEQYDQITITGTSSSGESITKVIPITHVDVTVPILHHLAAKALVNDLETGQSWMHDDFNDKYNGDTDALERAVMLKAQEIGMEWNIPGKWASFVGVSSGTTELGSRTYKCDRRELSELTRPISHWDNSVIPSSPSSYSSSALVRPMYIMRRESRSPPAMRIAPQQYHQPQQYSQPRSYCPPTDLHHQSPKQPADRKVSGYQPGNNGPSLSPGHNQQQLYGQQDRRIDQVGSRQSAFASLEPTITPVIYKRYRGQPASKGNGGDNSPTAGPDYGGDGGQPVATNHEDNGASLGDRGSGSGNSSGSRGNIGDYQGTGSGVVPGCDATFSGGNFAMPDESQSHHEVGQELFGLPTHLMEHGHLNMEPGVVPSSERVNQQLPKHEITFHDMVSALHNSGGFFAYDPSESPEMFRRVLACFQQDLMVRLEIYFDTEIRSLKPLGSKSIITYACRTMVCMVYLKKVFFEGKTQNSAGEMIKRAETFLNLPQATLQKFMAWIERHWHTDIEHPFEYGKLCTIWAPSAALLRLGHSSR